MVHAAGCRVRAQAAAVLQLPNAKKREMLKGFVMTQQKDQQQQLGGKESEAKAMVAMLHDDPTLNELAEASVWLASAPVAKVEQFVSCKVRPRESSISKPAAIPQLWACLLIPAARTPPRLDRASRRSPLCCPTSAGTPHAPTPTRSKWRR